MNLEVELACYEADLLLEAERKTRVVMLSGGLASWGVARRVVERHGEANTILLFADTLIEDEDLYRFLDDIEKTIMPVTRITEGRDPWQVFFDVRMMGSSRLDPCSRVLKREFMRKWLEDNCDPAMTVVYLGFDFNEEHRWARAQQHWQPWEVEAPLIDGQVFKDELLAELAAADIKIPRLYDMGFSHNNCGGFCVKAGQAQFAHLHKMLPERFAHHEEREREFQEFIGKPVTILKESVKGKSRPLSLTTLRERIEAQQTWDFDDWGGCACMEEPA